MRTHTSRTLAAGLATATVAAAALAGAALAAPAAQAATTTPRCHTSGLTAAFGTGKLAPSGSTQKTVTVVLRNTTHHTCAIKGFPGVDLKAGKHTWSLVRSSAKPKTVTVKKGAKAKFTLRYLPYHKGDGGRFAATKVLVTPPDERTSITLKWTYGSVLDQSGATHPGTYVNPVTGY
jgi:hypothetical protein